MGFRFRKSVNLGKNFRLNIGKNGVGYSYGVKGLRRSVSAKGRKSTTVSIPGSGLYYTNYDQSKHSGGSMNKSNRKNMSKSNSKSKGKGCGCLTIFLVLAVIGMIANACDPDSDTDADITEPASGIERAIESDNDGTDAADSEAADTVYFETQIAPETEIQETLPETETEAEPAETASAETAPVQEWTSAPETEPVVNEIQEVYILNTNSLKIHYSWCSSVDDMSEENKGTTTDPESMLNQGYTWCGRCH